MNSGLVKWLMLAVVAASVIANVVLYQTAKDLQREQATLQIDSTEMDALRQQAANADQVDGLRAELEKLRANQEELLKLRNQVSEMKGQAPELAALRRQNENLTRQLADLKKAMREQTERFRDEGAGGTQVKRASQQEDTGKSVQCVANLKRIGLAARIWGQANNNVFPPDFLAMRKELVLPKILFCPSDSRQVSVATWQQLDLNEVSYELLLAGAEVEGDPNQPLARCLVHGHICRADGSVQPAAKP